LGRDRRTWHKEQPGNLKESVNMQSLSIIGHPGGRYTIAQQLLAQSPFQTLRCVDLDHEQTLQAALTDSGHTLLVYCPPGIILARAIEQKHNADSEQTLQNWCDKARILLRHYMLNRERCTLINELALLHTPNTVLAALASKTGQAMATEAAQGTEQVLQPVIEALGTSLAYADSTSSSLYRDLETVADISGKDSVPQYQANLRKAFQHITAEHNKLQSAADHAQTLQKENDRLLLQLEQAQEELTHYSCEHQKLSEATNITTSTPKPEPHERTQELQEENELLLLQLHQVQEELEHYFYEYQKLSATGNALTISQQQTANAPAGFPLETLFDLQSDYIVGDNWYDAEHDGRWAGPGTDSTLTLPAVGQGRFELTFDIVHALDSRIVKDMQVLFNGEPLTLSHKFGKLPLKRFPCRVRTEIDTTDTPQQTPWQLRLRFPKTASPAPKGSDDKRQLTIRLRAIRVQALSTPHQG
jgi:hypothetical protein